jgi:putative membrane protein
MTTQTFTAAALAALVLNVTQGAWAQPQPQTQTPQTPPTQPAPSTPQTTPRTPPAAGQQAPAAKSDLSRADQDFIDDAAQAGMLEIEGSKLALQKSTNPAVKTFAQKMVDDHGKAADELKALAAKKGHPVPTELSVTQKAKLKTLDIRSESFDKAYAELIGVSAHEDAVKLFQKTSNEAKDPDVKAFAAKTLPTLQSHLKMGQDLKQTTQAAAKSK